MQKFSEIYDRAVERHGKATIQERFDHGATPARDVTTVSDSYCLAMMTMGVFQAGFSWKVIEQKWSGFEEAFFNFDVGRLAVMPEDAYLPYKEDTRVVRNWPKIRTIRANAEFVFRISDEFGSFGQFLAQWPATDTVGLWRAMQQGGSRLGGMTGPIFLRRVGKDTFILSQDVVAALIAAGVVDKNPTGKGALAAVQTAINHWQTETGYTQGTISRILASSAGTIQSSIYGSAEG